MTNIKILDNLISLYKKCASSGFTKIVRNENGTITILIPNGSNNPLIKHEFEYIPLQIRLITFISPKRAVKIANELEAFKNRNESATFIELSLHNRLGFLCGAVPILGISKDRYKLIARGINGEIIEKYSFNAFTINCGLDEYNKAANDQSV